jgi:O-methyltransferase
MKLKSDLSKEPYYNEIIKTSPRKLSKEELIYLLKYKKFMELSNVYSMCELPEVNQTYTLLKDIIDNNIQGSLVEMGVWHGGMCLWMQAIIKHYNVQKNIWLFDTYGYFPAPQHAKDKYIHNITKLLFENSPCVNKVIYNFEDLGLYDTNLKFIVGEFKNTVPTTRIDNIALLRCDADHYDSTKIILENYYWKISKGGYVIIDDYNNEFVGCKDAVLEFREQNNVMSKIIDTHGGSVYWKI